MPGQDPDWDLLSSYAGLLSLATTSIYVGSLGSLKAPRKPRDAAGGSPESDDDDDDDVTDRLSSAEAYLFPLLGSVTLLGLYLVVKFLGTAWINWLLGWYFTLAGVGSVWKCTISLARNLFGDSRWRTFQKLQFLVLKGPREITSVSVRTASLALFPLAVVPSALYSYSSAERKSALLTDVLALSFCHNALAVLKLDGFKTGCILLSGLFLYDVWWVFGTDVMVKVATSLDVPIKILWPKSARFATARGFTMLGLGDIVVPGMFIALALRFDQRRVRAGGKAPGSPYFRAALGAYVLGLATTMGVMHVFGAAQPALLYLSPACMLAFLGTALVRGELAEAWAWTDEADKPAEQGEPPEKPSATQTASGEVSHAVDVPGTGQAGGEDDEGSEADGVEQENKPRKRKSKKKRTG